MTFARGCAAVNEYSELFASDSICLTRPCHTRYVPPPRLNIKRECTEMAKKKFLPKHWKQIVENGSVYHKETAESIR